MLRCITCALRSGWGLGSVCCLLCIKDVILTRVIWIHVFCGSRVAPVSPVLLGLQCIAVVLENCCTYVEYERWAIPCVASRGLSNP